MSAVASQRRYPPPARYVWGRRLRERVEEQIEDVPVVQESQARSRA
ncbi:MAG: hypothetical protein ACR2ID_10350 [Chthoniobacterales bacterium]